MNELEKVAAQDVIDSARASKKQAMVRDAALVALKRQTEWWLPDGGLYTPSPEKIQKRIDSVVQYNDENDAVLRAMKDLILLQLSMRLEIAQCRAELSARGIWHKFKRWLCRK